LATDFSTLDSNIPTTINSNINNCNDNDIININSNDTKRQLLDDAYVRMNILYGILNSDPSTQQIQNITDQLKHLVENATNDQETINNLKSPTVRMKTKGKPASSKRGMINSEYMEKEERKRAKTIKQV
jgi:hypothetical protein